MVDTRVIYCGDNLEQLPKLPEHCVDLIYIDPPFNSNRNYEVFWGETKEKRAFEDRHASTRLHRIHAAPLRGTRPRAEAHRQLLLSLRLARLATTSKSCSTRFSARTISRMKSSGSEQLPMPTRTGSATFTI